MSYSEEKGNGLKQQQQQISAAVCRVTDAMVWEKSSRLPFASKPKRSHSRQLPAIDPTYQRQCGIPLSPKTFSENLMVMGAWDWQRVAEVRLRIIRHIVYLFHVFYMLGICIYILHHIHRRTGIASHRVEHDIYIYIFEHI